MDGLPLLFSDIPEMPLFQPVPLTTNRLCRVGKKDARTSEKPASNTVLCKFNTYAIAKKRSVF